MTAQSGREGRDVASVRAGTVTLLLGLAFVAATAYTYLLSLGDAFNPPHWARVLGLVWLPIGFFGTPIAYAVARTGDGRQRGRVGVLIALVGLVAFVALEFAVG